MSLKNLSAKNKIPKAFKNKLKNKRVKQIYARFEKSFNIKENFAVAVSGGPDSLTLAFLAKIYSIKNKLHSKFFIVDHRLRPDSSKESIKVKKILSKFSINSEILIWRGKKPLKNIQSIARNKRYELLFSKCKKLKINNILLGHHEDDLLENFLIRLLRGSGLKGLVSLDKQIKLGNYNLIRPLLDQKKKDLVYISNNVFKFYVKDPTNKDEKYQRTRVRNIIKDLENNGFDKNKFSKTIRNLKLSNNVINFYVNENLQKNTHFSSINKRAILNKRFFEQPYEVIFRSLSEVIKQISNKYYSVRGKKLDRIISEMENNRLLKVTLGGCILEKVSQSVIIYREN